MKFGVWFFALLCVASCAREPAFTIQAGDHMQPCVPCATPLTYRFGKFDPRFGITEEEFRTAVEKAIEHWENLADCQLFVEAPHGTMLVTLHYGWKQASLEKMREQEKRLPEIRSELETLHAKLRSLAAERDEFLRGESSATAKAAPMAQVAVQAQGLKRQFDSLQFELAEISTYLDLWKFDQGTAYFWGMPEKNVFSEIEVEVITNKADLEWELTHEFGHALGLPHLVNKDALMNPMPTVHALGAPDIAAFRSRLPWYRRIAAQLWAR